MFCEHIVIYQDKDYNNSKQFPLQVNKHRSDEGLEKNFRQLSMEEREKIETETLVNVNNFRRQKAVVPKANKPGRDYIVVKLAS